jgi:spermidine/putrescine transport system ATP-binding protein
VGASVLFTVRPEKLRITKQRPAAHGDAANSVEGTVDEPIYLGFQSKFFVKLADGTLLRVFKQHAKYLDDGPEIKWKDRVWVYWSAEDGYIVPAR